MALIFTTMCYAENQLDTYYLIFSNTEEGDFSVELGQEFILFSSDSDSIDLGNLEIFSQNIGSHYQFVAENSDLETLTVELRGFLLRKGYAKIINLDFATDDEKANQQHAQEERLGIWKLPLKEPQSEQNNPDTSKESNETSVISFLKEKWQTLWCLILEHKELIIPSICGCGILAFLGRTIISFLRTKKKTIFFGGANSAGKTTMAQYLLNPDASTADLLNQEPSLFIKKERIVRDDTNRRLTLKAVLLDTPGHELQYIIDELSQTLYAKIFKKKYAVIVLVAPTKSNQNHNEFDQSYINDQFTTISKLWLAVLKAKRTIKPETVILFINKLDLYDNKKKMISEFSKHKKLLEKTCSESKINFSCISGSVLDKTGMTELMQILKK